MFANKNAMFSSVKEHVSGTLTHKVTNHISARKGKKSLRLWIIPIVIMILFPPAFFLGRMPYGNFSMNSLYSPQRTVIKKAMFLVPHEDDEVFMSGSVIHGLVESGTEVTIVFETNGDYEIAGEIRMKEALGSSKILGVKDENVIFLGYGDSGDTASTTLYNWHEQQPLKSAAGFTSTYGLKEHPEYRMQVSGYHNTYTRDNLKRDLRDVISTIRPDAVFSIDYDRHPDHRSLSLMFEEVMGEMLKAESEYKPLVYKGYAYNTAYFAIDDFYLLNIAPTLKPTKSRLDDPRYELDTPCYNWDDRIRFPIPGDVLGYTLRSSLIWKALQLNASQKVKYITSNAANGDEVFWERKTGGLSYQADIEASSGEGAFLNDFKLIDSTDSMTAQLEPNQFVWKPDAADKQKQLKMTFHGNVTIDHLVLYDNPSLEDNILSGILSFSDGTRLEVGPLLTNGAATRIDFPNQKKSEWITFNMTSCSGQNAGLTEFEVYPESAPESVNFIKIMLNGGDNAFLYRYITTSKQDIRLDVYSNPKIVNLDDITFKIEKLSDDIGTLEENILHFDQNARRGSVFIRASLKGHDEVFDHILVILDDGTESFLIKGMQFYEKIMDKLLRKASVFMILPG